MILTKFNWISNFVQTAILEKMYRFHASILQPKLSDALVSNVLPVNFNFDLYCNPQYIPRLQPRILDKKCMANFDKTKY